MESADTCTPNIIKCSKNIEYDLQLFIAGKDPVSVQALKNIQMICEKHLKGSYQLQVTDIVKDFQEAVKNRVMITPMLIMKLDSARVTIIGNLNDTQKVLTELGVEE
ncbi:circadian clock KaiB family protein [Desulfobacterales bacterium HSG17]|nr:circadian clock KaiB family protein [Desulfobacterales bacterium HSG17]